MSHPLQEKLKELLKKRGYKNLRAFHRAFEADFDFSYEYLRQIYNGDKIPQSDITAQIAKAFEISPSKLVELAVQAKTARLVAKDLGKYQNLSELPATQPGEVSDNPQQNYQPISKEDQKLVRIFHQLGKQEQETAWDFLRFLKRKCRQELKNQNPSPEI